MTTIGDHLVGRAAEMAAVDDALGVIRERDRGVPGRPGRAGDRQDAPAGRAGGAGGRTWVHRARPAARPSSSATCRSGCSSMRWTSTSPAWTRSSSASLRDDVRVELAQVLPSLADHAADGGPVLQDERYRAHRAVRELLERLAVRRPLVLALDDVHWADPASVELLAALLRSPPDAAVLLVVAGRPRQLPERLAAALHRAERQGGVTRLELAGLAPEAAAELLGEQRRPRAGRRAVRGLGRQPLLPPAARARGRRRRRRRAAGRRGAGGGGRAARGDRLARRGARAPLRRHAPRAARRGRLRRPVRARPRSGGRRRQRRGRDGRLRRAARSRVDPRDRRPAPLPLPSSPRAPRGVRERARRVAARRPRALRAGPRRPRRAGAGAGASRRARPRATGISTRWRSSRRPGPARCSAPRRAPPAGSAPRCA